MNGVIHWGGVWRSSAAIGAVWMGVSGPPTPPPVVVYKPIYARVPYEVPQSRQTYDPAWMSQQFRSISRALQPVKVRDVLEDTRVMATDDVLFCDTTAGDIAVTLLPPAQVKFLPVTIKNIGPGTVTVVGTVDASTNPTLAQWEWMKIHSNGTLWGLIGTS